MLKDKSNEGKFSTTSLVLKDVLVYDVLRLWEGNFFFWVCVSSMPFPVCLPVQMDDLHLQVLNHGHIAWGDSGNSGDHPFGGHPGWRRLI